MLLETLLLIICFQIILSFCWCKSNVFRERIISRTKPATHSQTVSCSLISNLIVDIKCLWQSYRTFFGYYKCTFQRYRASVPNLLGSVDQQAVNGSSRCRNNAAVNCTHHVNRPHNKRKLLLNVFLSKNNGYSWSTSSYSFVTFILPFSINFQFFSYLIARSNCVCDGITHSKTLITHVLQIQV